MSIAPFLNKLNEYILNPLILLMFAVALLVFFWGLLRLIWYSNSDEERDTGRRVIVWGIVGMLIMISVYGSINLLLSTFGISTPDYIR